MVLPRVPENLGFWPHFAARPTEALQAASQQLFLLLHWQVRKGVWEQNLSVCSFPDHPHFHPHTTAPTKSSWGNAGPGCLQVF